MKRKKEDKERKSLGFGIKNGKTESHIELRKERLKEVEAEIRKRTPNYTNEGALDELDGAVAKPTETKKKSPSTIKEKLTQIRREYEDSLIAFETLAKKNKHGAQLIFATHDTNLLDLDIVRRDQIWFAEKDRVESTDIYSLVEFKDEDGKKVRNDRDIKRDYIRGRYGAIPFIGK